MKAMKFLALFCFVLTSSLHVLGQNSDVQKVDKPVTQSQSEIQPDPLNDLVTAKNQRNEKYRIGFQDTLEVRVFNHENLSQTVNVSPDGTIRMPRIDRPILVVCKTELELGAIIASHYKSYLKNPFVNVRAIEQRSQPFAVIGAVEKPGSFYLNRKIRLLELLAFAGGPDVEKSGAKIQVARVGNPANCPEAGQDDEKDEVVFFAYRINDVMDGKVNPWMEPGDIVSVLEAEEAYVVGEVKEPKEVSLKEPKTLTQAIAAAGGLGNEAETGKVRIQRQDLNSTVKTDLIFDLKDIQSKKIADPVLQANDIVEVPKSGFKTFRNGFLKALSGGFSNIFLGKF